MWLPSHLCEIAKLAISSPSTRLILGEPRAPVTHTGRPFVITAASAVYQWAVTVTGPENPAVAVLSITGVDVVLSTVPSFAHHVVGTHSRQGNTVTHGAAAQRGGLAREGIR